MKARLLSAYLVLRTLTPRKVWNLACVLASYWAARVVGKPVHWGMPVSIGIEPTTACNLRCPQCPSGLRSFTRPTGRLQPQMYQTVVNELHPTLLSLVMYFQGEPYLNPHFTDLVRAAADKSIYTSSSTNAHFLDSDTARKTVESGLSHLIVSMDGVTQASYEQYRVEGDLQKVLQGIRNLVHWKRELKSLTPFIELQFIVFRHNQHEVKAVQKLGRELGVNHVAIKTAQVYDYQQDEQWIPTIEKYRRYMQTQNGFVIKNKWLNHCWKLWHSAEITWDGRVLPCCFDKDAQHEMGRIGHKPFRAIWQSTAYHKFRSKLIQGRKEIEMCRNCTEGTQVSLGV
jgi:radical SAM protein with 4Fe4S-binding SPASM domain